MEGDRISDCGNPFDFAALPSVVLVRLLRLLRANFADVRNLSYVSQCLRRRVLENLSRVYIPRLVLDSGQRAEPDTTLARPVLSLRLACTDNLVGCQCPLPCSASCVALPSRRSAHTEVMQTISNLNLSGLKSLDLTNCCPPGQAEAYKALLKVLPLNPTLCCANLDHLSVDVTLINLSEIRQAIINVVYQHNDFDDGANIDYIINSAVSQILYTLLIFLDDLYNEVRGNDSLVRGVLVRKSKLKTLELNFQGREDSDWTQLDPNTFSLTESERLKNCLAFMVNEFKERVGLHYGITDHVKVTGIPSVFRKDILDLTSAAVNEACDLWPCDPHRKPFEISTEDHPQGFNLLVRFPRTWTCS